MARFPLIIVKIEEKKELLLNVVVCKQQQAKLQYRMTTISSCVSFHCPGFYQSNRSVIGLNRMTLFYLFGALTQLDQNILCESLILFNLRTKSISIKCNPTLTIFWNYRAIEPN